MFQRKSVQVLAWFGALSLISTAVSADPRNGRTPPPPRGAVGRATAAPRVRPAEPRREPRAGELRRDAGVRPRPVDVRPAPAATTVIRGRRVERDARGNRTVFRGNRVRYVESDYHVGGTPYRQRTYTRRGVRVVRTYEPFRFGARSYYAYRPVRRFNPAYYGYLRGPWAPTTVYAWSWINDPWYGHFRYYYTPYRYYPSPAYWLTDYLISQLLAERYATIRASHAAPAPYAPVDSMYGGNGYAPISEAHKNQLRLQAEAEIRAQETQTPIWIGSLLDDFNHLYVVSDDLSVIDANTGRACELNESDLIRLAERPAGDAVAARMVVVSSQRSSCRAGTQVWVSLENLQEFQNDASERFEDGMEELSSRYR